MAVFAEDILQAAEAAEQEIESAVKSLDRIVDHNQWKVIEAFQRQQVSDFHFAGSTGYAYN
ncbi:methionine gamma-lyase family protein, partial [Paenibacillus riograndensis]